MKITLISLYPDITTYGIRTLSACLKKDGHDVQNIFLRNRSHERYEDALLEGVASLSASADLIGISFMTNFFEDASQVTRILKERTDAPVLWGGIHPTIRPEECLEHADMVCIGEGEESLVELARKMEGGKDFSDTRGMWFRNKGVLVKNTLRPLIEDLDTIPFPDYGQEDDYIQRGGRIEKMNADLLRRYFCRDVFFHRPTYVSIATRGCVYGCTYCCNNTLNGMFPRQKKVRKRSIDNIIEELKRVKDNMDFIENIWFEDDAFFDYTEEEIADFCEKYKKNEIGLSLEIHGVNTFNFTRKKLSMLVETGLSIVRLGIQSGSQRTKKLYKRFYPNDLVVKTAGAINEFKDRLLVSYDVILDNPWETEEDLTETLMLIAELSPPFFLSIFSLTFYPGTELYEKAKGEGRIKDDVKEVYRKNYHTIRPTYLNELFFFMDYCSSRGRRISPKAMSLLTDKWMRRSGLSYLVYFILISSIYDLRTLFFRMFRIDLLLEMTRNARGMMGLRWCQIKIEK